MSREETEVVSLLGNFLSASDETALVGVVRLIELAKSEDDRYIVNHFLDDAAALDAFVRLLSRPKCHPARIFDACAELLRIAKKPARVLLLRLLCASAPRQRIRTAVSTLSDATLDSTVSALNLFSVMVELSSKQTMSKFGRQVPLKASSFTDALTFAQQGVRAARTRLVVAILNARHSEVSTSAATQSGVLLKLSDDLVELAKKDVHVPLIQSAIAAINSALVDNDAIPLDEKRRVLVSQRGAFKSLVALLANARIADAAASLLRHIVNEVAEGSRDYTLARDTEDTRMPNFALLLLLRHLRPKHRVLDSHLVVYVLHRCPDLYRPYLLRVAKHLPEPDAGLSIVRTSVAVCNLLARIFLCPLAPYLTTHSATLTEASATAATFYELTPQAAADEVLPEWFAEAAHRTLSSSGGNLLQLVFILQCAQAALNRAVAVKRCVKELFAERRRNTQAAIAASAPTGDSQRYAFDSLISHAVTSSALDDMDEDAYMSKLDALLQERFPRREVLQPHFLQSVVACSNPAPGSPGGVTTTTDTKHEFVLQRAYLYLNSAASIFSWRLPWSTVMTSPSYPWSPATQGVRCLRAYNETTIRTLCMLILNNLSRQVKLPKLTHIAIGAAGGGGQTATAATNGDKKKAVHVQPRADDHTKPPLLLDLLYWAIAAREEAQSSGNIAHAAFRAIAAVFQSAVHSSVTGSTVTEAEAALWLRHITADDAVMLVHSVNFVSQLHDGKQTAVVDANNEAGFLVAASKAFVARQREKANAAQTPWQQHIASYLDSFAKVVSKMEKRWEKRESVAAELLYGDRLAATESVDTAAPVVDVRTRLLRKAATDTATTDEHTTLIRFFTHRALPAIVTDRAPSEHPEVWAAIGAEAKVQLGLLNKQGWATSISGPWLVARAIVNASTPLPSELAPLMTALARSRRGRSDTSGDALQQLGFAVCGFSLCRATVLWGAPSNATALLTELREALLAAYGGTLSACDRTIFTALAVVDGPLSASGQTEQAVVGGDCTSTASSDHASDGGAPEESADSDDDAAHPAVRRSAILGGGAAKKHRAETATDAEPASSKQPTSSSASSSGLAVLRDARFLIGGAAALPTTTPEVEVLTTLVESFTDREIALNALRMPLRICTPSPSTARRHPLQLIFPDVMDGSNDGRGMRWYKSLAAPNGAVDPYECDPVSSLVVDPRYLLPLFYAVASLRFKHVTTVPSTTVTRLIPVAVRALSALDGGLRSLGLNCMALLYRSLHPIPRLAVNAIRLQLQQRASSDGAPPRLLTVHTAHAVLAFAPISNPSHPLHAVYTASLSLEDDLAVPLEDLLTEFPSSAVIGLPVLDRPGETATTPQLRHVLEQLRHSCCVWPDFAFVNRRHALQKLCITAGFLIGDGAIRSNLLRTIEAITLSHCTNANAAHDVVVPWCLETLNTLCSASDARTFDIPASEIMALLRRVYSTYRPSATTHRRVVSEIVRTLRFALHSKVLSRDLLFDGLQVIAAAWHGGGPHGFVLAAEEERSFCAEMLTALNDSGVTLSLIVAPGLVRLDAELRAKVTPRAVD